MSVNPSFLKWLLHDASEAGAYGEKTCYAIRREWTADTIVLYAKIAASYGIAALKLASDLESTVG
jgi:hypothetical protein